MNHVVAPGAAAANRYGLLYSDGSIGVLPEDSSLDRAIGERTDADIHETDTALMTKIARVTVVVHELLIDPATPVSAPVVCPHCGKPHGAP